MELRELLDKVSSFDKFVLPCGELTAQMRASAIKMRNESTDVLVKLLDQVDCVINERVVSEKKLENTASLKSLKI